MNYIEPYLMISSHILFSLGIYAVITRKNAVAILMGIEADFKFHKYQLYSF